jgi:hypothetical protein
MQNCTILLACSFNSQENYILARMKVCNLTLSLLKYSGICCHDIVMSVSEQLGVSAVKPKNSKFCGKSSSITSLFRMRTQPLLPHFLALALLHFFIVHLSPTASLCPIFLRCVQFSTVHLTAPLLLNQPFLLCIMLSFFCITHCSWTTLKIEIGSSSEHFTEKHSAFY